MPDKVPNATCWRCGLPSHMKFYITKRLACTSTTCSLSKARTGGDNHDARYCCDKSLKVFPMLVAPSALPRDATPGRDTSQERGAGNLPLLPRLPLDLTILHF